MLPLKALGAAAVIQNEDGEILLVKHSYGMLNWELPGGRAEEDESVVETAIRETFEETGLRVAAKRLTGIYYWPENDSHHFVYACAPAYEDQMARSASAETTECGYFSLDSLPRPISDFTVRRIQDALADDASLLPKAIGPRIWLE